MHRTLIVARLNGQNCERIADVFAESDRGELPGLIGVTGRSLFRFGGLYLHLVEGNHPIAPEVARHVRHPAFREVSAQLAPYVRAYDPETWRGPKDAMAEEFYRWEAGPGV